MTGFIFILELGKRVNRNYPRYVLPGAAVVIYRAYYCGPPCGPVRGQYLKESGEEGVRGGGAWALATRCFEDLHPPYGHSSEVLQVPVHHKKSGHTRILVSQCIWKLFYMILSMKCIIALCKKQSKMKPVYIPNLRILYC